MITNIRIMVAWQLPPNTNTPTHQVPPGLLPPSEITLTWLAIFCRYLSFRSYCIIWHPSLLCFLLCCVHFQCLQINFKASVSFKDGKEGRGWDVGTRYHNKLCVPYEVYLLNHSCQILRKCALAHAGVTTLHILHFALWWVDYNCKVSIHWCNTWIPWFYSHLTCCLKFYGIRIVRAVLDEDQIIFVERHLGRSEVI